MASPAGRLVRWLAGDPPERSFEQRIADGFEALVAKGYTPMAALAAAEAVETGREHRDLFFDGVRFDEGELRWYGVYAAGSPGGPIVQLPLPHASEAHQRGYAVLN